MAINKFKPISPDYFITSDPEASLAKFGHLNFLIEYLNKIVNGVLLKKTSTLSSGGSVKLQLDKINKQDTALLTSPEENVVWGVEVNAVAIASIAGGTVAKGDSFQGKYVFLFKKVNNVATLVSINTASTSYDPSMVTASFGFRVGAAQDLEVTFNAPTTALSTTFKLSAVLTITEEVI